MDEPIIVTKGYQLCALLTACEQVARSLDNVPDGQGRDNITNSLGTVLEMAEGLAGDMLIFAELHAKASQVEKAGA